MTKRPTKQQQAESDFTDDLYAILRNYQDGRYREENRCVVVGRLDSALTAVYDEVRAAFQKAQVKNVQRKGESQ